VKKNKKRKSIGAPFKRLQQQTDMLKVLLVQEMTLFYPVI